MHTDIYFGKLLVFHITRPQYNASNHVYSYHMYPDKLNSMKYQYCLEKLKPWLAHYVPSVEHSLTKIQLTKQLAIFWSSEKPTCAKIRTNIGKLHLFKTWKVVGGAVLLKWDKTSSQIVGRFLTKCFVTNYPYTKLTSFCLKLIG